MKELIKALQQVNFSTPDTTYEYRLYYDEDGNPLFYTTEKPNGEYIVVDKQDYINARYDIKIVNNTIIRPKNYIYNKLVPSETGTTTSSDDVSIISDTGQKWNLKRYQ